MASEKSRNWTAILYQENMAENWKDSISGVLQLPFCYVEHFPDDGRKAHVHIMISWDGPTTYKNALSVFKELDPTISICKRVISVPFLYKYFIHDTDDCRRKGKELIDESLRVSGNGFEVSDSSDSSKRKMAVLDFIFDKVGNGIVFSDFQEFYLFFRSLPDPEAYDACCLIFEKPFFFSKVIRFEYRQNTPDFEKMDS